MRNQEGETHVRKKKPTLISNEFVSVLDNTNICSFESSSMTGWRQIVVYKHDGIETKPSNRI